MSALPQPSPPCSPPAACAGPDKITYPAGFDKGVLYGTVDRYDTKQYRELYTSKAVVDAVKAGKPIPPGSTITMAIYKAKVDDKGAPVKDKNGRFQKGDPVAHMVMAKNTGWGAEYPADKRNGEWEYQAFAPRRQGERQGEPRHLLRLPQAARRARTS